MFASRSSRLARSNLPIGLLAPETWDSAPRRAMQPAPPASARPVDEEPWEMADSVVRSLRHALGADEAEALRWGPRSPLERLAYEQGVRPDAHARAVPAQGPAVASFAHNGSFDLATHFVGPDARLYRRDNGTADGAGWRHRRALEAAMGTHAPSRNGRSIFEAHFGQAATQRPEDLDPSIDSRRSGPSPFAAIPSVYNGIETRRHPVTGELRRVTVQPDGSEWLVDALLGASSMVRPPDHGVRSPRLAFGQQTPTPSAEELRAAEAEVRRIVAEVRAQGYPLTVDNIEYFLDGTGETRYFSPSVLRSRPAVAAADDRLRLHFENWIGGKYRDWPDGVALDNAVATLKDGEAMTLNSGWDARFNGGLDDEIFNRDFVGAVGASHLHGDGDLTFTRHGDLIEVEGDVLTMWRDPYDWDATKSVTMPDGRSFPEDLMGTAIPQSLFATLQDHGSARPFAMESQWRQRLKALLHHSIGAGWQLVPLSIKWTDEPWTAPLQRGRRPGAG
jgi:hypothetical protein